METALGHPLRDNSCQAQSSCVDLRVQGESEQSTDDEERERSLIKSQMNQNIESLNKDKLMAEVFPKDDGKE